MVPQWVDLQVITAQAGTERVLSQEHRCLEHAAATVNTVAARAYLAPTLALVLTLRCRHHPATLVLVQRLGRRAEVT